MDTDGNNEPSTSVDIEVNDEVEDETDKLIHTDLEAKTVNAIVAN